MLSLLSGPSEVCRELAERTRRLRLENEWTQHELAARSGVALSTLKYFERTGQISLERLVAIASTLGALEAFDGLLQLPPARSLEEIEARQTRRQRGRRTPR